MHYSEGESVHESSTFDIVFMVRVKADVAVITIPRRLLKHYFRKVRRFSIACSACGYIYDYVVDIERMQGIWQLGSLELFPSPGVVSLVVVMVVVVSYRSHISRHHFRFRCSLSLRARFGSIDKEFYSDSIPHAPSACQVPGSPDLLSLGPRLPSLLLLICCQF